MLVERFYHVMFSEEVTIGHACMCKLYGRKYSANAYQDQQKTGDYQDTQCSNNYTICIFHRLQ